MKERKGYKAASYTTHDEDKALVIKAISGNQDAYNILLCKYKPILYTAAKRRLPDYIVEDLEDVVMVVLGQAFLKIHQYNPEKSKFFTWIVACLHNYVNGIPNQKKRVATNSLEDIYPSQKNEDQPLEYEIPDEDRFDQNIDAKQTLKLVKTLIQKLPPDISKAMTLKFFKQLSQKEIAEELGCDVSLVWYKIKRGRELLKEMSDFDEIF
jgi:RNA polymerase sigma-70 factor (ECF subfamily)